ncbi:phytoene desaturase family protein [Aspergillus tubingensis]|uniref:phytoene desaturase family protein n=1 Tax=Aspergillus tubingensis TaxID=5068 RepID=UPI001577EE3F|nr:phytoene dehydrogenase [Aspergillus tubingensis]GFN18202.1 phytoene dehydrogenase [Aspergillus tubingensis]
MEPPTAIVVGGGAGGVAVAARLAKKGYKVTVVEKNADIGGRCSLMQENDYRFDQGPSLLLMPSFFHQIFHDLDTSISDEGITLRKCDPSYRIWFPDRDHIDLSTDIPSMKEQIEAYEGPRGFEGFLRFLVDSGRHYTLSCEHILHRNFATIWSLLQWDLLLALPRLHVFESIYTRASRYFHSDKLRQAFTFASMYLGMSPFDAPATYSLLQYTEITDGIWYPILDALVKISIRHNTTYILNTPVTSIALSDDHKHITGVHLSTGKFLPADIVIINADLTYAYNNLFPKTTYSESLQTKHTSCSSISFYWGLDTTLPNLQSHNIFLPPSSKYKSSFDAIFKNHQIPEHPSFYLHIPSKIDPSASPPHTDAIVVLVPVPHLLSPTTSSSSSSPTSPLNPHNATAYWHTITQSIRALILSTIHDLTGNDIEPHIVCERIETPLTWKDKYNLDRGAILGLSHSFLNVLCFRPRIQHDSIHGLFFVGASTHPGSGVPVVLGGSGVVVGVIEEWVERLRRGDTGDMGGWVGRGLGRRGVWVGGVVVVVVVVMMRVEMGMWMGEWFCGLEEAWMESGDESTWRMLLCAILGIGLVRNLCLACTGVPAEL